MSPSEGLSNSTLRGKLTNPVVLAKLHSLFGLKGNIQDTLGFADQIGRFVLQIPEIAETSSSRPGRFEK